MIILVLLFGHGIRLVNEGGLGFEVGLAVCLGFWVGFGFQEGKLFNEQLPDWAALFLANGTTAGGLTAIALMGIVSIRSRSRDKITVTMEVGSVTAVRELIQRFSRRLGWDRRAEDRLVLAAEEAMLFLLESQVVGTGPGGRASSWCACARSARTPSWSISQARPAPTRRQP